MTYVDRVVRGAREGSESTQRIATVELLGEIAEELHTANLLTFLHQMAEAGLVDESRVIATEIRSRLTGT